MKKIDRIKKYLDEVPVLQKEITELGSILKDGIEGNIEQLDISFTRAKKEEIEEDNDEYRGPFGLVLNFGGCSSDGKEKVSFEMTGKLKLKIMCLLLEEKKVRLQQIANYFENRNISIII